MEDKANKNQNLEINLKELLNQLWINWNILIRIVIGFLIIGIIIAFSIPREYTCIVKMAPEGTKSSITGNVSNLAAIAGINIGAGNDDGISLSLYPDVVQSMPFMADLINMQLIIKDNERETNLYNYLHDEEKYPWWNYVLAAPSILINRLRFGKDSISNIHINPYKLTRKQEKVFEMLKKRISVGIDKKNGIITTRVTLQDPDIAAIVADSLVNKLEKFIIVYRTNKAKQDFDFALKMFIDAKEKYYNAQINFASYMDKNKNVVLESVYVEQERLKNEQTLAYNVYSTLAQQVEKARLKVQEQTPCVTVIEPARVPVKKSNTSKLTILMLFCVFGGITGILKIMYLNWNKINISQ
jgi:uncharacterized protein involved in exopolysaccharide biosynthesis